VIVGDGHIQILGIGTIRVHSMVKGKNVKFTLLNVRYAPAMFANVFSSSVIDTSGYGLRQQDC